MANRVLSIQVGQTITRIVEMTDSKKNPQIHQLIKIPTPDGLVSDGTLLMTDEFIRTLKDQILGRCSTKKVIFVLSSGRIANREIVVPALKDNKVADFVRANAHEYFPVDLDQYTIVHRIVERINTENDKKMRLSVLAVPKELIASYENLANAVGLSIIGMSYNGFAVSEMMKHELRGGLKGCIEVGEDSSILTVMEGERILFQRNITYGVGEAVTAVQQSGLFGNQLSSVAAEQKMSQYPCVHLRYDEDDSLARIIEELKIVQSYNAEPVDANGLNELQDEVTENLRGLIGNVGRILDYYQSRNTDKRVDKFYLTGVGATCKDMRKLMANVLGTRIMDLAKFSNVTLDPSIQANYNNIADFFICIGAIFCPIEMSSGIVSKAGAASDDGPISLPVAVLIFGLCLIAALALTVYATITNHMVKDENLSLNTRINELSYIKQLDIEYAAAKADYDWSQAVALATANDNDNLVDFIGELEQKMPSEIRVLTLTSSQTSVTLSIEVGSKSAAADVVAQLRSFDSIVVTTLGTLADVEDDAGGHTVTFTVSCVYTGQLQSVIEQNAASQGFTDPQTLEKVTEDTQAVETTETPEGTAAEASAETTATETAPAETEKASEPATGEGE